MASLVFRVCAINFFILLLLSSLIESFRLMNHSRKFNVNMCKENQIDIKSIDAPAADIIKTPKIMKPMKSTTNLSARFLMMYTCKICSNRNAQMISKIAYSDGMVVSTCQKCSNRHLIADNQGKLDMPEFGKRVEDLLISKGENVQKINISIQDLDDNFIVDRDGVISLIPKNSDKVIINTPMLIYIYIHVYDIIYLFIPNMHVYIDAN
jgi:hypothetical protein